MTCHLFMFNKICRAPLSKGCKMVNKTKSDRIIKKPVEMYHQDCILKAAVMQNRCVHASKRSLFSLNLSQSSLGWSRPGAEKNVKNKSKHGIRVWMKCPKTLRSHSLRRRDQAPCCRKNKRRLLHHLSIKFFHWKHLQIWWIMQQWFVQIFH